MKIYPRFLLTCIFLLMPLTTFSSVVNPESPGPEFVETGLVPKPIIEVTQKIIDGYNNRDEALLASIFDFNALAETAAKDLYDNAKNERDFSKGLASSKTKMIKLYVDQLIRSDGYVVFLGYIKRNGQILPQLRMDLGEFGVDYLEFFIETNSSNETMVVDWYQLSTDQKVSKTIGVLAKLMTDPNPGLLKKLFGIVAIDKSIMNNFKAFGKARQAGDFAKANEIFNTFPESLRHSKIMISVAIGLASFMQNDDLYKQRLSELAQYHGDDPSAAFLLLDHYFYLADADKALENLRIMEQRIGKDGFTTYIKANLYYSLTDDRRRAIALYKDAIKIEPSYEASYQTLSALHIEDKNYGEAVNVYKMLEDYFEVEYSPEDFLESEDLKLFKESVEFKSWMSPRQTMSN